MFGSYWLPPMVAESVVGDAVVPVVWMVTCNVVECPAAMLAMSNVSTPSTGSAPPVADLNLTSLGIVSVTTTLVASDGPLFVAVIV